MLVDGRSKCERISDVLKDEVPNALSFGGVGGGGGGGATSSERGLLAAAGAGTGTGIDNVGGIGGRGGCGGAGACGTGDKDDVVVAAPLGIRPLSCTAADGGGMCAGGLCRMLDTALDMVEVVGTIAVCDLVSANEWVLFVGVHGVHAVCMCRCYVRCVLRALTEALSGSCGGGTEVLMGSPAPGIGTVKALNAGDVSFGIGAVVLSGANDLCCSAVNKSDGALLVCAMRELSSVAGVSLCSPSTAVVVAAAGAVVEEAAAVAAEQSYLVVSVRLEPLWLVLIVAVVQCADSPMQGAVAPPEDELAQSPHPASPYHQQLHL